MTNPSAAIGAGMSSDEEDAHQEKLRATYIEEAEQAIADREQTIKDLQESVKTAKAELKELKSGGRV